MTVTRWTTQSLMNLKTEEGKRYEIIDGELFVSTQPHLNHQLVCARLIILLGNWSMQSQAGKVIPAPGIIFDDDDNVAPDVAWASHLRLATIYQDDGKLHGAPELVIEVLSPGSTNAHRDQKMKLELYARHEVSEYWIIDWPNRELKVFQLSQLDHALALKQTLHEADFVQSPVLKGFSCQISTIFEGLL